MNLKCDCLSCKYIKQKSMEDPCYRCYNGSEYVYDGEEYNNFPLRIKTRAEDEKMYEDLVKSLREASGWKNTSVHYSLMKQAADAIDSLKHTVEILCGVKINLVRCCECIYHDDESQYHYCRKWRRNCPNDSDFFCKWGERKDGWQDDA